MTALSAVLIGALAGVLVAASACFFDGSRSDDPVGAISVHGLNGLWSTLAFLSYELWAMGYGYGL